MQSDRDKINKLLQGKVSQVEFEAYYRVETKTLAFGPRGGRIMVLAGLEKATVAELRHFSNIEDADRYTLKYTQLAKFNDEDEFVWKVAQNPKEIAELIEAGFEYVCEKEV